MGLTSWRFTSFRAMRQAFRSGSDKRAWVQVIRGRMAMGKRYLPRNAPRSHRRPQGAAGFTAAKIAPGDQ